MRGPRWLLFFSFLLAIFTRNLAFWPVGFEYAMFSDPFNLAKLAVDFGSLAVLLYAYMALLGMLWKWRDGKEARRASSSDS